MPYRFSSICCYIFLLTTLGVRLNADELEGFWRFSEQAIEQITNHTLESRKAEKNSGDSSASEISDAYRNHLRKIAILDDGRIHLQLIQYDWDDDPYPEYYRDFYLDYRTTGEGFSISNGDKEIFSGNIGSGIMSLKDFATGTVLKMNRVSSNKLPVISEGNFDQPKLDRQPKPRKLADPEYPAKLQIQGLSGVVRLSFYVNTDGSTSEIRVLSSPYPDLDKLAIEAILDSTFHPGKAEGKNVRTHVKLPITFR